MTHENFVARRAVGSIAFRWMLILALGLIAVATFAIPARAQEACETWTAEMMEDEGGSVLTAAVCTREFPDAWLLMSCFDGEVFIRYDLAYGAERLPDMGEVRDVDFEGEDGGDWLNMTYQEMDGLFASMVPKDSPFFDVLRKAGHVTINDMESFYPEKSISLEGSSAALETLFSGC